MPRLSRIAAGLGLGAGAIVAGTALAARAAEKAVPAEGRFLHLDGERIHYTDEGSGPPLVLIHGLGGQMRNFSHGMTERLTDDFRVIAIDRTGSGHSSRSSPLSAGLERQAAAVARVIEALALDRPTVVGHSLGGAVALRLAADRPDLVGALALVAPLTQVIEDPPEVFKPLAIRSRAARQAIAWTVATPSSLLRGKETLALVFGPETPPDDWGTRGGGYLGLRPSAYLNASDDLQAMETDMPSLVTAYDRVTAPTGVLYGRGDLILDADTHGGVAHQVAGAKLELVDGGHMLPVTQPQETADFIRRVAARRVDQPAG